MTAEELRKAIVSGMAENARKFIGVKPPRRGARRQSTRKTVRAAARRGE